MSAQSTATSLALHDWLDWAASFSVSTVDVEARFEPLAAGTRGFAAPFGTVVRGLLGERLRDLRCITRAPTCEGCGERANCDYASFYEPPPSGESHAADEANAVRPFWLKGLPMTSELPSDVTVRARLCLLGRAEEALPYFDVALRDSLAAVGMRAVEAGARGPTLGRSHVERITMAPAPTEIGDCTLRIEARSPLLLRGNETQCQAMCPRAPWLALLARSGVRRLARIRGYLNPASTANAPRAVFPDLTGVEVVEGGFENWRGSRFAHRQDKRLPLEGIVGAATVRGPGVGELWPLLKMLTVTSVGKQTAMGFGDLVVERVE